MHSKWQLLPAFLFHMHVYVLGVLKSAAMMAHRRFMRFMERYAEEHDLGFTKKQVKPPC